MREGGREEACDQADLVHYTWHFDLRRWSGCVVHVLKGFWACPGLAYRSRGDSEVWLVVWCGSVRWQGDGCGGALKGLWW